MFIHWLTLGENGYFQLVLHRDRTGEELGEGGGFSRPPPSPPTYGQPTTVGVFFVQSTFDFLYERSHFRRLNSPISGFFFSLFSVQQSKVQVIMPESSAVSPFYKVNIK